MLQEQKEIILGTYLPLMDKHFGYNLWKWALNKFKSQKDIFNKEEKIKIFEMMKNEFMKNKQQYKKESNICQVGLYIQQLLKG